MRHTEDGYLVLLGEILGNVYDELTTKPGRSIIAPGQEVAWDDCCDGQLWVRVSSTAAVYQGNSGCPIGYDLTLGVGIVRCVATVNDQGRAPRAQTITMDGHHGVRDMREIARALQCFQAPDAMRTRLGTWTPSGPMGGCAGGEWTLALRTDAQL